MRKLGWKVAAPIVVLLLSKSAFASLQVFPTRILLTDRVKTAALSIKHRGAKAVRYKISTVFYRMAKDGSLKKVRSPNASERSAMDMIRFSPRRATLQPNVEQVVRVMLRRRAGLSPGDYRAYLYFQEEDEAPQPEQSNAGAKTARFALKAKVAVAVPVIYRHGKTSLSAKVTTLKISKKADESYVHFSVVKGGNEFLYADATVFFTPNGGATKEVAFFRGVSSYVPERSFTYPIREKMDFKNGKLKVVIKRAEGEDGGVIAEKEIAI